MLRRIVYCIIVLSFLAACASTKAWHDTNPAYAEHRYQSHDLSLAWKSNKSAQGVRVAGTVSNPHYETTYQMFELKVTLLDESGIPVGEKIFSTEPGYFAGSQPFSLDIPIDNKDKVQRIKFFYSYGVGEDRFTGQFSSAP